MPPKHNVSQVLHEVLTLGELQLKLARSDAKDAVDRLVRPCAMLALTAVASAAGFLIVLIALAETLVLAGLPRAASYAIVGVLTMGLSAAVAVAAWKSLWSGPRAFYRSQEEMSKNVEWFRNVTRDFAERSMHSTSYPPR